MTPSMTHSGRVASSFMGRSSASQRSTELSQRDSAAGSSCERLERGTPPIVCASETTSSAMAVTRAAIALEAGDGPDAVFGG